MIVVTMTSWTKRIGSVKAVVESVMRNTVQPDRLYLNLSETEFDGIGLPEELFEYFKSDERLIINWVPGENTKAMKKVFPILKYLDEDDIIINADDDILFPEDLIESRLKDFEYYGREHCITSHPRTSIGFNGKMMIMQPTSLFQRRMLDNWERFLTRGILDTHNDDRTYIYVMWLNGYTNRGCTRWTVTELRDKYGLNLGDGMGENHVHLIGRRYDEVARMELGRDVDGMFGYYRKTDE